MRVVRFMQNLPRCGTYRGIPGGGGRTEDRKNEPEKNRKRKTRAGRREFSRGRYIAYVEMARAELSPAGAMGGAYRAPAMRCGNRGNTGICRAPYAGTERSCGAPGGS
ncbi:hypothetical protein GCM10009544_50250 [Streptomyces stramineus]|uniref:Uncharacterized protein n=1 Tax=Streptomyces stramineus TaxID=173861 RepID=A0ABN1AR94_9ACTN